MLAETNTSLEVQSLDASPLCAASCRAGAFWAVFSVIFIRLSSAGYEMVAFLIIPAVRLVMCNLMVYCTQHIENLIPAAVVFTVELFNSLYLAPSMTRVLSMYSFTDLMIIDTV